MLDIIISAIIGLISMVFGNTTFEAFQYGVSWLPYITITLSAISITLALLALFTIKERGFRIIGVLTLLTATAFVAFRVWLAVAFASIVATATGFDQLATSQVAGIVLTFALFSVIAWKK